MAKSLFRLKRREEAAEFVVDWLRAGTVPAFGAMQGMIQTMSTDRAFLKRYEEQLLVAAEEQPDNLVVQLYLASLHSQLGRVPDAWNVLQEAERRGLVENRSGARPVLVHDLLRHTMEPRETVASYTGLDIGELRARLEQLPEHAGLAMRLARILDADGRESDALPYYETVCRLNTNYWPALQRTAEILLSEGRLADAASHYGRVLWIQPGFLPAAVGLARASAMAGDQAGAVGALLRYGRMFAPDQGVLEVIALLDDQQGACERLRAALREASSKEPGNPFLWALLSAVEIKAGRIDEGRDAALSAERLGLTGSEGAPADCLIRAFSGAGPAPAGTDPAGGTRAPGSR
jgi:tetratricopeptide (TPR) repeat protein